MSQPIATDSRASNAIPGQRISQLDVLRGAAVLGIFWINIVVFGLPAGAYSVPGYLGESVTTNVALWAFSELLPDGAMRGLFSCLFGASALIYLSDAKLATQGIQRVEHYYRRNIILILFGVVHAYILLSPYEVLFAYGLLGLFLFPIRRLSPPALLVAGCLLLLLGDIEFRDTDTSTSGKALVSTELNNSHQVVTNYADIADVTDTVEITKTDDTLDASETPASREQRDESYRTSVLASMVEDMQLKRSSYDIIFADNLITAIEQHTIYMYGTHIFDIGGMMLIGMALLKLGILQGNCSSRFYLQMMIIGFLVGILLRGPAIYFEIIKDFVPDNPDEPGSVTYGITRLPIMLGYIGLLLWLYQFDMLRTVFKALAAVGRLALSNYIMQTMLSILLFYGFGLGLIGYFERYQLALVCIVVWMAQISFSAIWLKHYYYGPLEWLWRSAIYLQRQPLRLNARSNYQVT